VSEHDESVLVAAADDLDLPPAGAADSGGYLRPPIARIDGHTPAAPIECITGVPVQRATAERGSSSLRSRKA
jgi:hypothetical protein